MVGGVASGQYIERIQTAQKTIRGFIDRSAEEGKPFSVEWLKEKKVLEGFRDAVEALYSGATNLRTHVESQITSIGEKDLVTDIKALQTAWKTLEMLRGKGVISTYGSSGAKIVGRLFTRKVAVQGQRGSNSFVESLVTSVGSNKLRGALLLSLGFNETITTVDSASSKIEAVKRYPYGLSQKNPFVFWKDGTGGVHCTDSGHKDRSVSISGAQVLVGGQVFSSEGSMSLSEIDEQKQLIEKTLRSPNARFISSNRGKREAIDELQKIKAEFDGKSLLFPGAAIIFADSDTVCSIQLDKKGQETTVEVDLLTEPGKILIKGTKKELERIPEEYIDVTQAKATMDMQSLQQTRKHHKDFCALFPGVEVEDRFLMTAKSLGVGACGLCYSKQPAKSWWSWIKREASAQNHVEVAVVNGEGKVCRYRVISHYDGYEFHGIGENNFSGTAKNIEELKTSLGIKLLDFSVKEKEANDKERKIRQTVAFINGAADCKPREYKSQEEVEKYLREQKEFFGDVAPKGCVIWKKKRSGNGDDNYAEFYVTVDDPNGPITKQIDVRSIPGKIKGEFGGLGMENEIEGAAWNTKLGGLRNITFAAKLDTMRTYVTAAKKGLQEKAGGVSGKSSDEQLEMFTANLTVPNHEGAFLITFGKANTATIYVATAGKTYKTYTLVLRPVQNNPFVLFDVSGPDVKDSPFSSFNAMKNALKFSSVNAVSLQKNKHGLLGVIWEKVRQDSYMLRDWTLESISLRVKTLIAQTNASEPVWVAREQSARELLPATDRGRFNPLRLVDWIQKKYAAAKDMGYSFRQQAASLISSAGRLAPSTCVLSIYSEKGAKRDDYDVLFDVSNKEKPFKCNGTNYESLQQIVKSISPQAVSFKSLESKGATDCDAGIACIKKAGEKFFIGNPESWRHKWFFRKLTGAQTFEEKIEAATEWARKNPQKKVLCMYKETKEEEVDQQKVSCKTVRVIRIEEGKRTDLTLIPRSKDRVDVFLGESFVRNSSIESWISSTVGGVSLSEAK